LHGKDTWKVNTFGGVVFLKAFAYVIYGARVPTGAENPRGCRKVVWSPDYIYVPATVGPDFIKMGY